MHIIAERFDYVWLSGYSLDGVIPNHSVLNKVHKHWDKEVLYLLCSRKAYLYMVVRLRMRD